ncbi:hypothetical protein ACFQS4_00505 [Saliphagus sp. GCM10025317]
MRTGVVPSFVLVLVFVAVASSGRSRSGTAGRPATGESTEERRDAAGEREPAERTQCPRQTGRNRDEHGAEPAPETPTDQPDPGSDGSPGSDDAVDDRWRHPGESNRRCHRHLGNSLESKLQSGEETVRNRHVGVRDAGGSRGVRCPPEQANRDDEQPGEEQTGGRKETDAGAAVVSIGATALVGSGFVFAVRLVRRLVGRVVGLVARVVRPVVALLVGRRLVRVGSVAPLAVAVVGAVLAVGLGSRLEVEVVVVAHGVLVGVVAVAGRGEERGGGDDREDTTDDEGGVVAVVSHTIASCVVDP